MLTAKMHETPVFVVRVCGNLVIGVEQLFLLLHEDHERLKLVVPDNPPQFVIVVLVKIWVLEILRSRRGSVLRLLSVKLDHFEVLSENVVIAVGYSVVIVQTSSTAHGFSTYLYFQIISFFFTYRFKYIFFSFF